MPMTVKRSEACTQVGKASAFQARFISISTYGEMSLHSWFGNGVFIKIKSLLFNGVVFPFHL